MGESSGIARGTRKVARRAAGESRGVGGLPGRPRSFSLKSAVFDVPSVTAASEKEALLPLLYQDASPTTVRLFGVRSVAATMVPFQTATGPGPPRLPM